MIAALSAADEIAAEIDEPVPVPVPDERHHGPVQEKDLSYPERALGGELRGVVPGASRALASYSTVTLLARLRGLSMSRPSLAAAW